MNASEKLSALLRIADDFRAERCDALLSAADAESRRILGEAHRGARRRLREALTPGRDRHATEIADAGTRLATQRRLRGQRRLVAALDEARPRIEAALRHRWQTSGGRARWAAHHLAIAMKRLPAAPWIIRHAPEWAADERELAARWLQGHGIADVRFEPDAAIEAGVKVITGHNTLDASLAGLLADRTEIEARLLHHLGGAT